LIDITNENYNAEDSLIDECLQEMKELSLNYCYYKIPINNP